MAVLLILAGVDLLFGRRLPWLGTVLALGAAALVVVVLLGANAWGLAPTVDPRTEQFSAPVGTASAADVERFSLGRATVRPAAISQDLIVADVTHIGDIEFAATGDPTKHVMLRQTEAQTFGWTNWLSTWNRDGAYYWMVGLNPAVPMGLSVNGGLGDVELDLQEFQLTALRVNGGAGDVAIVLPASSRTYEARINGGLGSFMIDVPDGAALRVTTSGGLGAADLPAGMVRLSGEGREGAWETPGYGSAEAQVTIDYNRGAGGLKAH